MKKRLLGFFMVMLVLLSVIVPDRVALADTLDPEVTLNVSSDTAKGALTVVNSYAKTNYGISNLFSVKKVEAKTCRVTFKKSEYKLLPLEDRQVLMGEVLDTVQSSSLNSRDRNRLYNFLMEQDSATANLFRKMSENTSGDFATAWSWFQKIAPAYRQLLATVALFTCALLGVTVVIDISYITLPGMQVGLRFLSGFVDKGKSAEGGKPILVSHEAFFALQSAESDDSKDVLTEYLLKKVKMFILVGLCMLYLNSGKIYNVVAWIMGFFEEVLPDFR